MLESFDRYAPDARWEKCPHCERGKLRWHSRFPEDPRKAPVTQFYLCDRCGLIPLGFGIGAGKEMRRCWHCTRWCCIGKMVVERSRASRDRRAGATDSYPNPPTINYYCGKRCRLRESIAEQREIRHKGILNYYKPLVFNALAAFIGGVG